MFSIIKKIQSYYTVKRFLIQATCIPTILAGIYYILFASDIYITTTKFSVFAEGGSPLLETSGLSGLITSDKNKDLMAVRDFIISPSMLKKLQDDINIRAVYTTKIADLLSRMPEDATREDFFDYYLSMISVHLNPEASIISLQTRGFTPEDSKRVADTILVYSDQFINAILEKVRKDALDFSRSELLKAENDIEIMMEKINDFKKENKNFNPDAETTGLLAIIQELKAQKTALNAELSVKSRVLSRDHYEIKELQRKIYSLNSQILKKEKSLVGTNSDLSDISLTHERLLMQKEFAAKRYQIALLSYQEAIKIANKKSKYIVTITEPMLADEALEPEKLYIIVTIFVVSFLSASLLLLFHASIKDHVIK